MLKALLIFVVAMGALMGAGAWLSGDGKESKSASSVFQFLFEKGIVAGLVIVVLVIAALWLVNEFIGRGYRARAVLEQFAASHQLEYGDAHLDQMSGRAHGEVDGMAFEVAVARGLPWNLEDRGRQVNCYIMKLTVPGIPESLHLGLRPKDTQSEDRIETWQGRDLDYHETEDTKDQVRTATGYKTSNPDWYKVTTGDPEFDDRCLGWGTDESSIREWLTPARRPVVAETVARGDLVIIRGALLWQSTDVPGTADALDAALERLRAAARDISR